MFFVLRNCSIAFALLASLCFNEVQASHRLSKSDLLLRVDAIQQSQDVAGTFALRFGAALRAPTGSNEQIELVHALRETLAENFSIAFIFESSTAYLFASASPDFEANDFNSLLELVQILSSQVTFAANMVGNFSVESYSQDKCKRGRHVNLRALDFLVATDIDEISHIITLINEYHVIETKSDGFKIQNLIATALNEIPFCCFPPAPQT